MRVSQFYLPTLKEDPSEAEVISHRLMVRAGMIRKLTSGIYTILPFGLRAVEKTAAIVREEMNRSGALEVLMSMVQPAELWQETGRWDVYGKELLRLKDRHHRDCCLGPTHEEVITDLIRKEVHSYRQLPLNLYQIQTKFRDEIRPRFGLMRCREFIMKDAYSFDRDEEEAFETYKEMVRAYTRIFSRLGLKFRSVEADSGAIGGSYSHEFMVLADTGEDVIAVCSNCEYASNLEKAKINFKPREDPLPEIPSMQKSVTPDTHTVKKVADFLNLPEKKIIKTMLYDVDGRKVAALVPGDRELNEVKLKNYFNAAEVSLATPDQVQEWTGAPVGFAGPINLKGFFIIADQLLKLDTDWVVGANQKDAHLIHIDLNRDLHIDDYTDLSTILKSDPCPECSGKLKFYKGIEVGHVFKLGTKYSQAMQATYLDEKGEEQEMVMGCYGIGITRVVAAAIEQNHDQDGIIFPPPIAPFEVMVIALNYKDREVRDKAEEIYNALISQGIEVFLDDRDERPGFKFKDADLIGLPIQIVLGAKGIKNNQVEVKDRRSGEKRELKLDDFLNNFLSFRQEVLKGWEVD